MSKASAALASAIAAAPPASAPAAPPPGVSAPAPAIPQPAGNVDFSEPVVRPFVRQYNSDFGGDTTGGEAPVDAFSVAASFDEMNASATAANPDDGSIPKPDASAADPAVADPAADPNAPVTPPAPEKPALLGREERRRLLAAIETETSKRQQETTLATAVAEAARLKATLATGTLQEKLALLGLNKQQAWDALEGIVAGDVKIPDATPAVPKTGDIDPQIAELKAKLDAVLSEREADRQSATLGQIATLTATVPKPFTNLEGVDGLRKIEAVCRQIYTMQGNKGSVDAVRAAQVVEEHFEGEFVRKYGEGAAAFIRGGAAPAPAAAAPKTPAPNRPAVGRRTGAAPIPGNGGDPLPFDRAQRHDAIFAEIRQMEGDLT